MKSTNPSNLAQSIISEVEKVLLGKPDAIRLAVTCFLAEGHLLIDDIPGVGKTTMALAMAKAMGCDFQRIQFTSDLLPSDMLGVSIYNPQTQSFDFKEGPIFHHLVLADEINRASPKTQSALLESMQEKQVSLDNKTHNLPRPFFVMATQNPQEHHGTFPLPESQLDRFLMRLNLGYPDEEVETSILQGDSLTSRWQTTKAVATPDQLLETIEKVRQVQVVEGIDRYIVQITRSTRTSPLIDLGISPRGTLALRRSVQAYAFTQGRDYVTPDDVKAVAIPVMSHRIRIHGHYNGETRQTADSVVTDIVSQVPVPA